MKFFIFIHIRPKSFNKFQQWPPIKTISKHWDVDLVVQTCYNESNVSQKEVMEFEMTTDLEHLPDSRELKKFFTCYQEMNETIDRKANKFLLAKFGAFIADLPKEEAEQYLKMGKGCVKLIKDIKDHMEYAYQLQVCYKRNNNEVSGHEKFILNSCFPNSLFSSTFTYTTKPKLKKMRPNQRHRRFSEIRRRIVT